MLADLRIGLSFDELEVKEKLSKTLEHVALGDLERLAHHVSTLAEHLDDEDELVRYHLCTALMIVGCESSEKLTEVSNALDARLDDENVYVRGRAVEALGVLVRSDADAVLPDELPQPNDDEEPFVAERARFALADDGLGGDEQIETDERIGTVAAIRETTDEQW